MSVLRLAIPSPLRRLFDYLPPADATAAQLAALRPGVRLDVPFGSRHLTACLMEVREDSELPVATLKAAQQILDAAPVLDPDMLALCQWAADYYLHPIGEVISAALPRRLRDGLPPLPPGEAGWRLSTRGRGLPPGAVGRSPRQAQAVELMQVQGEVSDRSLRDAGISAAVMRTLQDKGLVTACQIDTAFKAQCGAGLELNAEQAGALSSILAAGERFSCHLLEGVTGSGKTEIYLQLIAHCLQRGRQALVLIPEIGLTPQTLARFEARFQAHIAVLHSGLSDTRRLRAWDAARRGEAHIVIGTRSAVFTPLARPGLIIVDEEHDGSFKQQDGFRYSARDVAVKRAQMLDCPVLLGSATPALESIANALDGRYLHHRLSRRAGSGQLPRIHAVDLRREALQGGLSAQLIDSLEQRLAGGEQALLFLNRRGYAPTLQCHDCGWVAGCDACDARLTVHRRQGRLRCHHCGASHVLPRNCPDCHGPQLTASGLGTEQTEDFLRARFRQWPVYRVDSDTMQGRDAMATLVQEINRGQPCILLGTQMLTKGHHFPAVGLVAVIDADALLFSADFRGEERMAQLLTQVAGRAGRTGGDGEVLIQTHYPDHPVLQAMLHSDYFQQARSLLEARRASGMPPAGRLVLLRTDCTDAACGEDFLRTLREHCSAQLAPGTHLVGPLPSPMQRRAGRYRSQLLLIAADLAGARSGARLLAGRAEAQTARRGLKWSIDVDPQDIF